MNFFNELELIIEAKNPKTKTELFESFYQNYKCGGVYFEKEYKTKQFLMPSYSEICKIISPQDVPKRKNLTTNEGQITLLHAIAHIEYSAIDLALDGAYRFSGLQKEYYDDWLEVASDELRHFWMLERLLNELGATYGDLEVHDALFEASQKTQTLLERMAVVPRYLEANGLDATPMILEKLEKLPKTPMIQKIIKTLNTILVEEVEHVKKGDVWFSFACKEANVSKDIYFEIIQKYYPRSFLRPQNLNDAARKEAGFSQSELEFMTKRHAE